MATNGVMSVKDRTELRRLIRIRFDLLKNQVAQRRSELEAQIRSEIENEFEKTTTQFQGEANTIFEEYKKLEDKWVALCSKAKKQGVEPTKSLSYHAYYGHEEKLAFFPIDMRGKIQAKLTELKLQAGFKDTNLAEIQLELEEELIIGALGSTEARKFLDKIPTVDTLLPLEKNKAPQITEK